MCAFSLHDDFLQLGGSGHSFVMSVGVSIDLTAEVLDSMGAKVTPQPTVTFQSTAPGVVATTAGGHLTALAPGSAYVRAEVSGDRRFRPDSVAVRVVQPLWGARHLARSDLALRDLRHTGWPGT